METKLQSYKDHVIELLHKMDADIRRTKGDWEKRRGVFRDGGYVYKENLNIFESEIHSIQTVKEMVQSMDISGYDTINDFKAHLISELEDLYDRSVLIRSGISIVIETIKRFDETIPKSTI